MFIHIDTVFQVALQKKSLNAVKPISVANWHRKIPKWEIMRPGNFSPNKIIFADSNWQWQSRLLSLLFLKKQGSITPPDHRAHQTVSFALGVMLSLQFFEDSRSLKCGRFTFPRIPGMGNVPRRLRKFFSKIAVHCLLFRRMVICLNLEFELDWIYIYIYIHFCH